MRTPLSPQTASREAAKNTNDEKKSISRIEIEYLKIRISSFPIFL